MPGPVDSNAAYSQQKKIGERCGIMKPVDLTLVLSALKNGFKLWKNKSLLAGNIVVRRLNTGDEP